MTAGDICIIRGGVYSQALNINKNGNSNNYLTFKAADGEDVEIKATSYLNGWQLHSGNIYKAPVNMSINSRFRTVYHNGEYMDLARWPNNTDNNRWTVDCTPVTGGDGSHFTVSSMPNINWSNGGIVYYLGAHSGTSWSRPVTSNTTTRINIPPVNIVNDWPFTNHNPTQWRNNPGNNRGQLFLFNKLEALDYAREWFYDSNDNTLYFQTPDGNIPANNSVEYAVRQYAVQLSGDYIKLEGLKVFGGAIKINNRADYNQIINCEITHGSEGHDSLTNSGAQVGEASIEVQGDFTLIKGCTIDHSSVSGITIAGWAADDCTIEGNTISNTDYVGIHASPIRTSGDRMKILKNTIFNTGRDGMYVAGTDSEIAYNDVSHSQLINADSGIFYTVGNSTDKNNVIHHNWFHDATAPSYSHNPNDPGKAAGIYLDNDSQGYLVHHNVVWNVSWSGYQVNWNNERLNFYHNTIWNAERAMDSWDINGPQLDNKIYNNYANTGSWFQGNGSHEFDIKDSPIFANSPFEDVNNQNFMPAEGSALVDAASAISGFAKHIVGDSADIGAYERGGTYWTAGVNAIEDTTPLDPLSLNATSQPTTIYFDNLQNPTQVLADKDFQVEIKGLNPSSIYNLFNQIHNENTSIQIAGFSKQGITGVTSILVDVNFAFFPNNPVTINNSDTFSWTSSLFIPGEGKQDDFVITGLTLDNTLSTNNFDSNTIKIYPNPTSGEIFINGLNASKTSFSILNINGQKIRATKNFKGLSSGIYFLKIIADDKLFVKKVMVK